MWNIAKLASGAKVPMRIVFHSERTVSSNGAGWSARFSNNSAYSGVTTMRSRANSATTLIARLYKHGALQTSTNRDFVAFQGRCVGGRSVKNTSELQSRMRTTYAVSSCKKKKTNQ